MFNYETRVIKEVKVPRIFLDVDGAHVGFKERRVGALDDEIGKRSSL